jgi:acetyl esterase/lipase
MTFKALMIPLVAVTASALLAACSPSATLNALLPKDTYELTSDVAYGANPRQKLDIYHPAKPAPAGGYPVVVFFYGGSWNNGARADYKFVGEALASRGVLALLADYRLYPEVRYPDFLDDSARALAYGLNQARRLGGNPGKVFVMGHSAGGYNAAMLALDPRWLKAHGQSTQSLAGWIGLAGPYDFYPIGNPDVKPVFNHPNYPPDSQPIQFARPGSPPSFIGVGRSDSLVDPQRNSAQMAQRLESAGVPVTYRVYERANHVTLAGAFARPLHWIAPVLDDVVDFIARTPAAKVPPA